MWIVDPVVNHVPDIASIHTEHDQVNVEDVDCRSCVNPVPDIASIHT